jgi:hypothetical protein
MEARQAATARKEEIIREQRYCSKIIRGENTIVVVFLTRSTNTSFIDISPIKHK